VKPFNLRRLALSGGIALLLSAPAVAGVQDIREMQQQNNGTFRVLCTNQQQEIVSSDQITNNQVCNSRREDRRWGDWRRDDRRRDRDRDRGQDLLTCKGNRFFDSVYITRNSDGRQLGGNMSQAQCQQAIEASRRGLVCTGSYYTDSVYVTRISDGQALTRGLSVAQCLDAVRTGNNYSY
jgi:hypothetical protein